MKSQHYPNEFPVDLDKKGVIHQHYAVVRDFFADGGEVSSWVKATIMQKSYVRSSQQKDFIGGEGAG